MTMKKRAEADEVRLQKRSIQKEGVKNRTQTKKAHQKNAKKIQKGEMSAATRKRELEYERQLEKEEAARKHVEAEKKAIREKQREAAKLEELEASLLEQLKHTQNAENAAFADLEDAMIEASKSKGPEKK